MGELLVKNSVMTETRTATMDAVPIVVKNNLSHVKQETVYLQADALHSKQEVAPHKCWELIAHRCV